MVFKPGTVTADMYVIAIGNDDVKNILYHQLERIGVGRDNIFIYAFPHNAEYYKIYEQTFKREHCPICKSKKFDIIQNDIAKCEQCDHGFRLHVPEKILPHYHDKTYWEQDKNRNGMYNVKPGKEWDTWLGERMSLLDHFQLLSHDDPSQINILEFGCAEGMILSDFSTYSIGKGVNAVAATYVGKKKN